MAAKSAGRHYRERLRNDSDQEHREVIDDILSDQDTWTIPSYIELAGGERLMGDETERPDSQNSKYTVLIELESRTTWRCTQHRLSVDA